MNNFLNYLSNVRIPSAYDALVCICTLDVPKTVFVCWAAAALTAAVAIYKTITGHAMTIRKLQRWRELEAQARGETS